MALSAKRPSKSDKLRQKILNEVKDESKGKTKRLNAEIEESLYKKIKVRAAEEGHSVSEITRKLWIEYLSI